MKPLVSVMIPCYNAAHTLPLALASLLAQTYPHWECIIVDDGSADQPGEVIAGIGDARIRFWRFAENRGRAAARQQALDMAQGDYLCMVDADDWIYPTKLERQVTVLESNPALAVLSSGMAIVDADQQLVGVRSAGSHGEGVTRFDPIAIPQPPPFAFAPSMIRMSSAKATAFDEQFTIAEDKDFLMRLLADHQSAVLADILYVYSEISSVTFAKIRQSLRNNRRMWMPYRSQHAAAIYQLCLTSLAKEAIYGLLFATGQGERLLRSRSQTPRPDHIADFERARYSVLDRYAKTSSLPRSVDNP